MARKKNSYGMDGDIVISLRNVYKEYDKATAALNGISLDVHQGEFVFIVGDSGSGKSTLIKLLLRELKPTEGEVRVLGYDLTTLPNRKIPKFRRNLGIVFQDFRLLKDRNIYENVAFAQRIIQVPGSAIKRNVPAILETVGLGNRYKSKPSQLSGGEQQRVALARALINEPLILLADEPTGNLDPRNSWEIMQLLKQVNEQGTTVLVVTHNDTIVNTMHERVIRMERGIIISDEDHGEYIPEGAEIDEKGGVVMPLPGPDSDYAETDASGRTDSGSDYSGTDEDEEDDEPVRVRRPTAKPTAKPAPSKPKVKAPAETETLDMTADLDTAEFDTADMDTADLDTAEMDTAELESARATTGEMDTASLSDTDFLTETITDDLEAIIEELGSLDEDEEE